jgi:hypothetical protein
MADYVTLAQARAYVGITDGSITIDDATISLAITAASAVIDHSTDTTFTGTIPSAIQLACLLLVNRWVKRKRAPFGVTGSPEMGTEMRIWARDPDVKDLIRPYRVVWGAVGATDESE